MDTIFLIIGGCAFLIGAIYIATIATYGVELTEDDFGLLDTSFSFSEESKMIHFDGKQEYNAYYSVTNLPLIAQVFGAKYYIMRIGLISIHNIRIKRGSKLHNRIDEIMKDQLCG